MPPGPHQGGAIEAEVVVEAATTNRSLVVPDLISDHLIIADCAGFLLTTWVQLLTAVFGPSQRHFGSWH